VTGAPTPTAPPAGGAQPAPPPGGGQPPASVEARVETLPPRLASVDRPVTVTGTVAEVRPRPDGAEVRVRTAAGDVVLRTAQPVQAGAPATVQIPPGNPPTRAVLQAPLPAPPGQPAPAAAPPPVAPALPPAVSLPAAGALPALRPGIVVGIQVLPALPAAPGAAAAAWGGLAAAAPAGGPAAPQAAGGAAAPPLPGATAAPSPSGLPAIPGAAALPGAPPAVGAAGAIPTGALPAAGTAAPAGGPASGVPGSAPGATAAPWALPATAPAPAGPGGTVRGAAGQPAAVGGAPAAAGVGGAASPGAAVPGAANTGAAVPGSAAPGSAVPGAVPAAGPGQAVVVATAPPGQALVLPATTAAGLLAGTVVGATAAGGAVVATGAGGGVVLQAEAPVGTRVAFEPGARPAPGAAGQQAAPPPLDPAGRGPWPALDQALAALQAADPAAARVLAAQLLARPDTRLATAILVFMGAVRAGVDGRGLVGERAARALEAVGRRDVLDRLGEDMRGLSRADASGDWRAYPVPFAGDGGLDRVVVRVKRREDDEESAADRLRRGGEVRFLVDLVLSRLGPLQLDGLVRPRRFDLIVRTEAALPADARSEMRSAFADRLAEIGSAGDLVFRSGRAAGWIPLEPAPPTGRGVVV
jgi:hypothetical protein